MEKTFEELADKHSKIIDYLGGDRKILGYKNVIELMQQVREETIAECKLIADKYYFQNSRNIIRDINNLPTDRIKTKQ